MLQNIWGRPQLSFTKTFSVKISSLEGKKRKKGKLLLLNQYGNCAVSIPAVCTPEDKEKVVGALHTEGDKKMPGARNLMSNSGDRKDN